MENGRKVAIITGACGGGIGRSTALTLAREGYIVVLNYRSQVCSHTGGAASGSSPLGKGNHCQCDRSRPGRPLWFFGRSYKSL